MNKLKIVAIAVVALFTVVVVRSPDDATEAGSKCIDPRWPSPLRFN